MNGKYDKYEYLDNPCLLEDFKKTYVKSLNIFVNDEIFEKKVSNLPILKSSAITKYEKLIEKEEQERNKRNSKEKVPSKEKLNNLQKKEAKNKGITMRYIIIDRELIEINLHSIEESNECNNKLTDPFNSYFHEDNEKIRQKALEQIVSNIIPKMKPTTLKTEKDFIERERLYTENPTNTNLLKDLDLLESRYKQYKIEDQKRAEKFAPYSKVFQESCDNHSIYSLDQKIDYFVYLKKTKFADLPNIYNNRTKNNSPKSISPLKRLSTKSNRNNVSIRRGSNVNNLNTIQASGQKTNDMTDSNANSNWFFGNNSKNSSTITKMVNKNYDNTNNNNNYILPTPVCKLTKINTVDMGIKYINELKSKVKLNEDNFSEAIMEKFENNLDTKIKSFQFLKKNFESSTKFMDKLRMCLRCVEIHNEKMTLRECEINADRLCYLVLKKYFNFSQLHYLNLSRNNLNDIGGVYLFTLIDQFSSSFDYLNVSYNKLGRQSIETLIRILENNCIKIYSLSIGGNQLGDKLFSDLCIGISKNSYVKKLFVNDNNLSKISSVILGTILKYDKKIKLLDVSKNKFGDDNVGYMLKGLICNTTLDILMINDMGLTNKSLRVFETTLCINSNLRELFLERNKFTNKGWRVLSDILNKNKFIEYISLVGNKLEGDTLDLICESQRQIKTRVISKTDYFMQVSANEEINFYEYFY